ncbi:MAG: class I SAM-dependent methyltransferase [Bacteroidota bacterium]|nr:class I SAM-dependent methyltransferase [Bacteroidota bacterium]
MENLFTSQEFESFPEFKINEQAYFSNSSKKSSLLYHLGLNSLANAISEFIDLNKNLSQSESENYLKTAAIVHKLLDAILAAENNCSKEEIRSKLLEVREIHRQSPFFVRTQDWPRGYAGDFETIEYIINGENMSLQNSLGYYLEAIILNSPIVQQHRNKVSHQSKLILEKAYEFEEAKILSIGCGSSADLRFIQNSLKRTNVKVTLFDMDEGALACSEEKLLNLKDKCTFIQGNLLRLVKKIEDKFDLIVIGGVFDYLADKSIKSILSKIFHENLNSNGEIFFTNIAKGNPYRTWMEYCFDWELIERTKEDIINLYKESSLPYSTISVCKEETGLTYLAQIKKS